MTNNNLFIVAKISLKPQFLSEGKNAILGILDKTRAEEGCVQFELHESRSDSILVLYEEWKSEDALKAHYEQPYTKAIFAEYDQWLSEPIEIHSLQKHEESVPQSREIQR